MALYRETAHGGSHGRTDGRTDAYEQTLTNGITVSCWTPIDMHTYTVYSSCAAQHHEQ